MRVVPGVGLIGLLVAVVALAPAAAVAAPALGIAQLAGADGCTAQVDTRDEDEDDAAANRTCRRGRGLLDATNLAVSPDGSSLYASASESGALVSFSRNPRTGALTQLGCISNNGSNGLDGTERQCVDGNALAGAYSLAVSPDGRNVYVASYTSGGIAMFERNPATGATRQIGCIRPVVTCIGARALAGAASITVTRDGKHVYLASSIADGILALARDPDTGMLKPLGCISDDGTDGMCVNGNTMRGAAAVVASPDGRFVYLAAGDSGAVLTFERNAETGALTQRGCLMDDAPSGGSCVRAHALADPVALAMAPDGRTLFVAAYDSNAIVVLARNTSTGALRQVGCVSTPYEDERDGCGHVPLLESPVAVSVTRDLRRLYAAVDSGVLAFDRNTVTGTLAPAGCISYRGYWDDEAVASCVIARGVSGASGVELSPDGRNVYVSAWGSNSVAVFAPSVSVAQVADRAERGMLAVRLACPALHTGSCAGRLDVAPIGRAPRIAAPARFEVEVGRDAVVRMRLTSAAKRALADGARLRMLVTATERGGEAGPVRRRALLRGKPVPHDRAAPPRRG
ncbi:MAG: lactonase family protein [Pseudomonadota bacterium]